MRGITLRAALVHCLSRLFFKSVQLNVTTNTATVLFQTQTTSDVTKAVNNVYTQSQSYTALYFCYTFFLGQPVSVYKTIFRPPHHFFFC